MSACWELQMPPTAKAVLISLADNANDTGHCWPSISCIARRTCFGRTAVIEAIKWLETVGALRADRTDRYRTTYIITPGKYSADKLVRQADKSGRRTSTPNGKLVRQADDEVRQADDEVRQADTNRKEPSLTVIEATVKKAGTPAKPSDVEDQVWIDWIALRKAKRAPVTETVLVGARREAGKAGLPLNRFLEIWCSRGSQGLQASWLTDHERGRSRAGPAQPPGKQMQGIMALEEMKNAIRNRMAGAGNPDGTAKAVLPVTGPDARR